MTSDEMKQRNIDERGAQFDQGRSVHHSGHLTL
jgi:hypothetical protein